ncbi:unnamed protein product [Caenorhabditis brenneri]
MTSIPLHQLPDEAFQRVLRCMPIYDQLAFSLCSKNTKKSIKSLKLKAQQINIQFYDFIEIEIRLANLIQFFSEIKHGNDFTNNQINVREDIEVHVSEHGEAPIKWKWNFENFELKEWLHHFCEVLHHPKIDSLFFDDRNINDKCIEPIQKVIKGLQIGSLGVSRDLTTEFAQKALESFSNYERLYLDQIPFDNHKLNKLLVQNLQSVCIPRAERLKIDQILLTNFQRIQQYISLLTEKDLNRFLKLWICGSNPRLKYFDTEWRPQNGSVLFNANVIFNGIKYEKVPLNSEEVYKDYIKKNYYNEIKLAGGYRIRRFDETTTVVVVTKNRFKFIVE